MLKVVETIIVKHSTTKVQNLSKKNIGNVMNTYLLKSYEYIL